MAGGAKKRKAVKKKGKNGDAHNNSNSSSNSSSTHSQDRTMSGSENPRSLDDRESDSGEVEREEEEKEDGQEEVEAVIYEKVNGKDGKGLSDKFAEIEKEAMYEKSGSLGLDFGGTDVAKETPISFFIREDSVPRNGVTVQDEEVVVEEERSMVAVWENLKDLHGGLVSKNYQVNLTPEQETSIAKDASVTLVEDVSSLPQDKIAADIQSPVSSGNAELALQISDVKEEFSSMSKGRQPVTTVSEIVYKDEEKSSVAPTVDLSGKYEGFKTVADIQSPLSSGITESGSIKSAESALQISDVKEEFFTISKGQQPVETVSEIVYRYEEKSSVDLNSKYEGFKTFDTDKQGEQLVAPAFDFSTKLDDFNTSDSIKQVEEQSVLPSVVLSTTVDDFKTQETGKHLAEQSVPPAVDLSTKLDDFNTLDTVKQVEEKSVPPSVALSTKVDDFKTLETSKHLEEQSVPAAVALSTKLDDFKTLETNKHLEEKSVASAVTTKIVVESVKNKETVEQSDNQAGLTVANTSSEVDNVREIETQTRSIDQTLIAPNPLPIQRTSWLGCCGLFEAFSGTSK